MHSALTLDVRAQRATQAVFRQVRTQESLEDSDCLHVEAPLPSVSFTGDLMTPGAVATSHFASGWLVAYLVATVVFAIGLVIGAFVHVSHPSQLSRHPSLPSPVYGRGAGGEASLLRSSPGSPAWSIAYGRGQSQGSGFRAACQPSDP